MLRLHAREALHSDWVASHTGGERACSKIGAICSPHVWCCSAGWISSHQPSSGCRWVVGATQEAAEQQAGKQFPSQRFTLIQVSSGALFTISPPS